MRFPFAIPPFCDSSLFKVVGDEVSDGRAGALQFGFVGEVDDKHVKLFVIGRRASPEAFKAVDVGFAGVFDVSGVPLRGPRFIKSVQQVADKFQERPGAIPRDWSGQR